MSVIYIKIPNSVALPKVKSANFQPHLEANRQKSLAFLSIIANKLHLAKQFTFGKVLRLWRSSRVIITIIYICKKQNIMTCHVLFVIQINVQKHNKNVCYLYKNSK